MMVLGLLLMAAAAGAVVVFFAEGTATSATSVTILERTLRAGQFEIFLAGAVTATVFLAELLLVIAGSRRALALRRELRHARTMGRTRVSPPEHERQKPRDGLTAADTTPSGRHAARGDGRLVGDRRNHTQ